ncbi:PREDICTED: uncharacterized protein LOC109154196 [Ipomoea nil]|uniref:uncharacterized protein LOC109154196 n=1 Tax=Ipomoea nil TaxID=35883 RepID=UPI000900FE24|nr:PREDICTED: uncharacterized protein LOC109154196 [Ipomoea nil]
MRIFKWSPDFRPDMESPIVPVWIAFEGLPAHLRDKRALYSIANLIGKPLKVDASTLTHNRPSMARVCVELNVCNSLQYQIWIINSSYGGFAQKVCYEYIPPYCMGCRKFGHTESDCRITQPHPDPRRETPKSKEVDTTQQPLLVPPRKRWRPLLTQSEEPQYVGSDDPVNPQIDTTPVDSESAALPLTIPDVNASIGRVLIDDQGIQPSPSSDSQAGHHSDGDEVRNARVFSQSLPLDSWKEASKLFDTKLGKSKADDFIAVTKKKSRPRKDYSANTPSVTTRLAAVIEPFLPTSRLENFAREFRFSGGYASRESKIWLLWSDSFEIEVEEDSDQYVMCKARYEPWQLTFHFIAIYAKHTRADRAQLWTQLSDCIEDNRPLLLAGDFNVISSISEYRGNALPDVNCISDFSNFITDKSLIDLATIGRLYTWHGICNTGAVWKRLDRFLMNPPLRDYFTEVRINVLARTSSDHSPILLSGTNNTLSCPKQFHFQTMWTSHPDFINVVRLNWNQQADGGGMRALAFKIKRLKHCLRIWNRDTFGNVFDRIRVLESCVAEAENTFDDDPSPGSRESLHKLQADLLQALKQEEMFWKQKARVKWLKEGDSNTRFFHAVVKDRHRRQRISAIKSGTGELLTTQPAIQTEAVSFFSGLFSAEDCPGMEALL